MNISFEGKTALVTGASKGIGEDITLALANAGAKVYALSRTLADLDILKSKNEKIETVVCDLGDWDATDKAVSALGPVDLLVNNAGIVILESFLDVSRDAYEKTFDLNVRAVIQVSQIIARGMISRGTGGSIVNISSQASMLALTKHSSYCASKAALDSLTKSMALELGPKKIRVNACNPTVVLTDLGKRAWSDPADAGPMMARIPLGRFAECEDVTNVVLFLLSDKSAMVNGVTLPIDGGFTITGV